MKRLVIAICVLFSSAVASAHPLSQGALEITVDRQKVAVKAHVTVEEVSAANQYAPSDPLPGPWAAEGTGAFEKHAEYLASHLTVIVDGVARVGRVIGVKPPEGESVTKNSMATYEIDYPLDKSAAPPARVQILSTVLNDAHFPPGVSWEATYIVRIGQPGGFADEGLLLTGKESIVFEPRWDSGGAAVQSGEAPHVDRGAMFGAFLVHGINHILTGYDHLLFISALVLAAATLWDLVKVVTAFTIAHTLTLSLAALDLVHVSERIVEPLIAASIVFVAVQNIYWPRQSRGWTRLAAAFFFGLFHGLGFAGGLLDAMRQMSGSTTLLAILAFSIGVELGHQVVVIPLFTAIKLARRTRPTELARETLRHRVRRFGSMGISLAGMYYLAFALWGSFAPGTH